MSDVRLTATNPVDSSVVPVACNEKGELLLEQPPEFDGNLAGDLTVGGYLTVNNQCYFQQDVNITAWPNAEGGVQGQIRMGESASQVPGERIKLALWQRGRDEKDAFGIGVSSGSLDYSVSVSSAKHSFYIGKFEEVPESEGFTTKVAEISTFGISNWGTTGGFITYPTADGQFSYANRNPTNTDWANIIFSNGGAQFRGEVIVQSRDSLWWLTESGGLCHMVPVQTRDSVATADLVDGVPREPRQEFVPPQLRNIPAELTMVEEQLAKVMEKLRMIPEAGWEVWDGSSDDDDK